MRTLTKDGRTQRVPAWAKELGINKSIIYRRIRAGKSDEECLGKTKIIGIVITYKGNTKTVPEWTKETGTHRCTIWSRLRKGWPLHEVLYGRESERPVTVNGVTLTKSQWAKKTGIRLGLISDRICVRGWTPERAVTTPAIKKVSLLTFNGDTLSVREWAKRYGLGPHALWMRVNRLGWPLEKALTTPPRAQEPMERMDVGGRAQPGQRFSFSL